MTSAVESINLEYSEDEETPDEAKGQSTTTEPLIEQFIDPPYDLEAQENGFFGICHERNYGGPTQSHEKCSVLRVSTIAN